jgi:hypothetical protein
MMQYELEARENDLPMSDCVGEQHSNLLRLEMARALN